MTEFAFSELFPTGPDETPYRLLTTDGVSTFEADGSTFLQVEPEALTVLTATAMRDIAHLLRPGHLQQLRNILDDPEASDNDRFVATELLQNACIAAGGVLPGCQDTGTAIVKGKKGQYVVVRGGHDELHIARGVFDTYQTSNLRYSQMAPLDMWDEVNTGTNLPAEIKIASVDGDAYKLLFMAKGGGSANKSYLFQETKALLNPTSFLNFLDEKLRMLGTAACPPYHLAIVVGGTSAEYCLEVAKLASTRSLDSLPQEGSAARPRDPRPRDGGRGARAHPRLRHRRPVRRQVLLPRRAGHPPSPPRRVLPRRDRGVVLGRPPGAGARSPRRACSSNSSRRTRPGSCPRSPTGTSAATTVQIDLNRPMAEIRAELSRHPVTTRLSLTGTLVVARDIAHAKIKERLDAGEEMPAYLRDHAVYYAGPAKTPEGYASGSFGPTTAGRMDAYVEQFQAAGGSFVMLAKGNRSKQVTDACNDHGGFYLGSIGGPAAKLAQDCITKVEVLDYPELGMEAVWKIDVVDFPAFIVVDDKGNDFFTEVSTPRRVTISPRAGAAG